MNPWLEPGEPADWIRHLGDPVRAKQAFHRLLHAGPSALPAVRQGLADPNSEVRMYCARALDQLVDPESWPALIAMLEDPDPRVRVHTLHAIACDRCKTSETGDCRPGVEEVLPRAIEILARDPFYHVRAMAVEVVARWVHEDERAVQALEAARDTDPKPMVRKKAGWFAPGGVRYRKSAPR